MEIGTRRKHHKELGTWKREHGVRNIGIGTCSWEEGDGNIE